MGASIKSGRPCLPRPRAATWRTLVGPLCAIGLVSAMVVASPKPPAVRADDSAMGSDPRDFAHVGDTLYFRASGAHGDGLWGTDGTRAGTRIVREFRSGDPGPYGLTAWRGRLLFFASDPTHGMGLWTSDGTTAGTRQLRAIDPTDDYEYPVLDSLTAVGDRVFFVVDTCQSDHGQQLWVSDGTPAGTFRVRSSRCRSDTGDSTDLGALAAGGDRLFFRVDTAGRGAELWTSDGTSAGTRLVRDIWPGREGSNPTFIVAMGRNVYFRADDGVRGEELWRSDGTAGGTYLVKDVRPGSEPSGAGWLLTRVGQRLYFFASDGTSEGLWMSDGTGAGTGLVKAFDLHGYEAWVSALTDVGGRLFFEGWDATAGRELWISDGTTAGTRRVKDIRPGKKASDMDVLTDIGGRLFFAASDRTHGRELWVSDGTSSGTRLVRDIRPGLETGPCLEGVELAGLHGTVYVDASDGVHGCELWRSDGTRAGTWMVKDIATP
jgi:ELWxxDGT repeat protein